MSALEAIGTSLSTEQEAKNARPSRRRTKRMAIFKRRSPDTQDQVSSSTAQNQPSQQYGDSGTAPQYEDSGRNPQYQDPQYQGTGAAPQYERTDRANQAVGAPRSAALT